MKVVMNLNDDLIPRLKDHIKRTKHESMTSFINDVLADYLSNKYDLSEKIYEVDALPDIDVDDKSKTLISDYEASGLIGSKYEKLTVTLLIIVADVTANLPL